MVAAGATATARGVTPTTSPRALVDDLVRCAVFEGQRYCLGVGWTDRTQAQVRASMTTVATRQASRATPVAQRTGAMSPYDALRQTARLSPLARADAQRAELTEAARSVAKVWLLRHQVQGVPLPPHFFALHPEVSRSSATAGHAASVRAPSPQAGHHHATSWLDYPKKASVLDSSDVVQQRRTYWCGPASMQMITWGWSGHRRTQKLWARRLGTTTSGTSTGQMVHAVNRYTGWDKPSYAGPYVVLDIHDWSFHDWVLLMMRHTVDYRAPVILNPLLSTQFFPYLDHSGSGHFQVGRGYKRRTDKRPVLGYFEPWNQQRFHPDEPYIPRVQWHDAYQSYRADKANFAQDVGV